MAHSLRSTTLCAKLGKAFLPGGSQITSGGLLVLSTTRLKFSYSAHSFRVQHYILREAQQNKKPMGFAVTARICSVGYDDLTDGV